MTPCGTCCDERSSLSFQRAAHGGDADNWTWGRWYYCRPGAEDLGRWEAYGHPGWETEVGVSFSGPEYQIQVGRRPVGRLGGAKPAFHAHVERYANARTTPFPGRESHGLDEWYADGLPREHRYQGEEVFRCGARVWQTEGGIGVPDADDAPDYLLVMAGGGEGGGHIDVATDCYIWFGGCLHGEGGGEGGGTLPMYASESFDLAGGGEGGGEMPTDGSEGFALAGGGEGGGAMDLDAADSFDLAGGGEGGGAIGSGGAGPTFHDAFLVPHETDTPAEISLPGVMEGDTILLYIVGNGDKTVTTPDGFTIIGTGSDPSFAPEWFLYAKPAGPSEPPTFDLTWSGGGFISYTIVTVSNGGTITPGGVLISDLSSVAPTDIVGIVPQSLILLLFWSVSAVGIDTPPAWPTEGATDDGPPLGGIWWEEEAPGPDTEDGSFVLTDSVEYAVGFVEIQPLPDEGEIP